MRTRCSYDPAAAEEFKRNIAAWRPHLEAWQKTLELIARKAGIHRKFRPGLLLCEQNKAFTTTGLGEPVVYLQPELLQDLIEREPDPHAIAGYLKPAADHELAHLDGLMGRGHDEEFIAAREDLAQRTGSVMPKIVEIAEGLLRKAEGMPRPRRQHEVRESLRRPAGAVPVVRAVKMVRGAVGPGCLRPDWRRRRPSGACPSWGCCYVAAEAVFHLAGGAKAGLRPMFVRHEGSPHWYLLDARGRVVDPTADQFSTPPDYSQGTGKGFLTLAPSARAAVLMEAARSGERVEGCPLPRTVREESEACPCRFKSESLPQPVPRDALVRAARFIGRLREPFGGDPVDPFDVAMEAFRTENFSAAQSNALLRELQRRGLLIKRGKQYMTAPELKVDVEQLARDIAAEITAQHRSEAFAHEVARNSEALALAGLQGHAAELWLEEMPTTSSLAREIFLGRTRLRVREHVEAQPIYDPTTRKQTLVHLLIANPRPLRGPTNEGGHMLIAEDGPGDWVITFFNPRHEPTGHVGPWDFESALERAAEYGPLDELVPALLPARPPPCPRLVSSGEEVEEALTRGEATALTATARVLPELALLAAEALPASDRAAWRQLLTVARAQDQQTFVADALVLLTKHKEQRRFSGGYQVVSRRGQYIVRFKGTEPYPAMTASKLVEWARRLPLVGALRQAEDLRAQVLAGRKPRVPAAVPISRSEADLIKASAEVAETLPRPHSPRDSTAEQPLAEQICRARAILDVIGLRRVVVRVDNGAVELEHVAPEQLEMLREIGFVMSWISGRLYLLERLPPYGVVRDTHGLVARAEELDWWEWSRAHAQGAVDDAGAHIGRLGRIWLVGAPERHPWTGDFFRDADLTKANAETLPCGPICAPDHRQSTKPRLEYSVGRDKSGWYLSVYLESCQADAAFMEVNRSGNGHDWEDLLRAEIEAEDPRAAAALAWDPESDLFEVRSAREKPIRKLERVLARLLADKQSLRRALHRLVDTAQRSPRRVA